MSAALPTPDSALEVYSSSAAGWQKLAVVSSDDDERAASAAAETALRDDLSLIVNAEHLVVLAGLGTSLGIPASKSGKVPPNMSGLWESVSVLDSFKRVEPKLSADIVARQNLEHVLSDAQARLAISPDDGDLQAFVNEAEAIVWERCSFVDEASVLTGHEVFLRKVARRSTRLQRTQLFTTNYDLAFETAARRARFNVIDGFGYAGRDFDGGSFDLDYVRRRPGEQLALEPSVFHLLKLHGSVDWDSTGTTITKTTGKPSSPVLIYPSTAKYQLSYEQPYLEFMSRFQIALRQADVGLIVVGFGFNDFHIASPIEAALRSNIGLRAVIVAPDVRGDGRPSTVAWVEELISHGDRRLTLLRGKFDDLVRYLPDVPATEERDAHSVRVALRAAGESR